MLVVPWRILQLGGTESQVGTGIGLFFAVYVVSCRLLGQHLDRLGVKKMAMCAAALAMVLMSAMMFINSVAMMIAMMGVLGVMPSIFWPPVMSWISAGRTDTNLTRRMSIFNMQWSMGLITGPLLGGYLLNLGGERGQVLAFGACVILEACTLIMIVSARRLHTHELPHKRERKPIAAELPSFLLTSRIALAVIHITSISLGGLIALLLTEMSLGPDFNGQINAGRCLLLMIAFLVLGRTKRWHFNRWFLLVAQILFAVILLAVFKCQSGWLLATLTILSAVPVAICYASSQFYGLSSNAPRAQSMAIHEMLIGVGVAIGSFGGGYLAEQIGIRGTYPVMAGLMALAVAAQLFILLGGGRKSELATTK